MIYDKYVRGNSWIAPDGNLWIGTDNGLGILNEDNWTIYNRNNSSWPGYDISCIDFEYINAEKSIFWIGLQQHPTISRFASGLIKYDSNEWSVISNDYISVNSVYVDDIGRLWVGTDQGLIMYQNDEKKTFSEPCLSQTSIQAIAVDRQLNVWIGTGNSIWQNNSGCNLIKYNETEITVYDSTNSILSDHSINALAIDDLGNKWIGTNKGLIQYDDISWRIIDTTNSQLPSNYIQTLVFSPDKKLWIGTDCGLVEYDGYTMNIFNSENTCLLSNSITAISFGYNKNLFVGTRLGGLTVFDDFNLIVDTGDNEKIILPNQIFLYQNYPNPFNPSTIIKFYLPKSDFIHLKIYNLKGQILETLLSEYRDAGEHEIKWTAEELPSGIYFYKLQAGEFSEIKKLILQK